MSNRMNQNVRHEVVVEPSNIFTTVFHPANELGKYEMGLLSNVYLTLFNVGLMLLSLALIGYSGFLINKYNSTFAKVMMIISCYLFLTSFAGLFLPLMMNPRIASYIWAGMTAVMTIGVILTWIFVTFRPSQFVAKAVETEGAASLYRRNGAVWLRNNLDSMKIFTALGGVLSLTALGVYTWLMSNLNDVTRTKVIRPAVNASGNRVVNEAYV